ncbi:MAG: TetR/AcrR family transcriptional regulator [Roseibium sp.]|uniref:TetR/AcrR family transcriptional regulator n=1 Tax=Roseibium sp. TaxID=1936156 RepID=UPI00260D9CAF|nr:TetR/AcrR family transcriptional regulator [Roseibium sp.]MCV0425395.1 TetR/AcrR family transcriptional regulator [Roseibium sp.]
MKRKRSDEENEKKSPRKLAGAAVLQASVTAALYRALFEEWAESGYAALRMERIAARAGVGKAALYRRWKSKRDFVYEAVERTATAITPFPNTGSLAEDVLAITRSFAIVLRHPLVRRILPDLHAERARSDELDELVVRVGQDRRSQGLALIERAVERGELSKATDREMALDFLIAPLYWAIIVQRRKLNAKEIDGIAATVTISIRNMTR